MQNWFTSPAMPLGLHALTSILSTLAYVWNLGPHNNRMAATYPGIASQSQIGQRGAILQCFYLHQRRKVFLENPSRFSGCPSGSRKASWHHWWTHRNGTTVTGPNQLRSVLGTRGLAKCFHLTSEQNWAKIWPHSWLSVGHILMEVEEVTLGDKVMISNVIQLQFT